MMAHIITIGEIDISSRRHYQHLWGKLHINLINQCSGQRGCWLTGINQYHGPGDGRPVCVSEVQAQGLRQHSPSTSQSQQRTQANKG